MTTPLSRQPECSACRHEAHSPCRCEQGGCECREVPVPGVYPKEPT